MRYLIALIVLAVICFAPTSFAQQITLCGIESGTSLQPKGYQQLTVSTVALALTLPTGGPIYKANIQVEANPIRWRDDGTNPTASVGFLQIANSYFTACGAAIGNLRVIRQGAADATLNVTYYGYD